MKPTIGRKSTEAKMQRNVTERGREKQELTLLLELLGVVRFKAKGTNIFFVMYVNKFFFFGVGGGSLNNLYWISVTCNPSTD